MFPLGAGTPADCHTSRIARNAGCRRTVPPGPECGIFPENVIHKHVHADAVRRLPFVRILKFFGGSLHREQMDQGVARSTVGNVLQRIIFSSERPGCGGLFLNYSFQLAWILLKSVERRHNFWISSKSVLDFFIVSSEIPMCEFAGS